MSAGTDMGFPLLTSHHAHPTGLKNICHASQCKNGECEAMVNTYASCSFGDAEKLGQCMKGVCHQDAQCKAEPGFDGQACDPPGGAPVLSWCTNQDDGKCQNGVCEFVILEGELCPLECMLGRCDKEGDCDDAEPLVHPDGVWCEFNGNCFPPNEPQCRMGACERIKPAADAIA